MMTDFHSSQRRNFLRTSGMVLGAASAGWLPQRSVAAQPLRNGVFLIDTRFRAAADSMQRRLRTADALVPVHADVTDLWQHGLRRLCRSGEFRLAGTTTESVYFCLQNLIGPREFAHADIRRIDTDLFEWEIANG